MDCARRHVRLVSISYDSHELDEIDENHDYEAMSGYLPSSRRILPVGALGGYENDKTLTRWTDGLMERWRDGDGDSIRSF